MESEGEGGGKGEKERVLGVGSALYLSRSIARGTTRCGPGRAWCAGRGERGVRAAPFPRRAGRGRQLGEQRGRTVGVGGTRGRPCPRRLRGRGPCSSFVCVASFARRGAGHARCSAAWQALKNQTRAGGLAVERVWGGGPLQWQWRVWPVSHGGLTCSPLSPHTRSSASSDNCLRLCRLLDQKRRGRATSPCDSRESRARLFPGKKLNTTLALVSRL